MEAALPRTTGLLDEIQIYRPNTSARRSKMHRQSAIFKSNVAIRIRVVKEILLPGPRRGTFALIHANLQTEPTLCHTPQRCYASGHCGRQFEMKADCAALTIRSLPDA